MSFAFRCLTFLCLALSLTLWGAQSSLAQSNDDQESAPAAAADDKPDAKEPAEKQPASPKPTEPAAALADETPAAAVEGDDFAKLKGEWTALLTELRAKLLEYRDAPADEREPIRQEYAVLVKQGEQLLPKLLAAAESSFEKNPDPQGAPAKFLAEAIKDQVFGRQEFELAARVGKALTAAGLKDPTLQEATGVALFQTGQFADAAKNLAQVAQQQKLQPGSEQVMQQAQQQILRETHQSQILELEEKLAEMEKPSEQAVRELLNLLRISEQNFDDYDAAARISQQMIDKGVDDKGLYDVAGVAFFMTNQFDKAKTYLTKADEAGRITQLGRMSLDNVDYYQELWKEEQGFREADAKGEPLPQVLVKTNKGDVTLELFENEAPKTVGNFVNLVEKGFYDGLIFHRVLPGFMAQGGDPEGTGGGGPGYTIVDEVNQPKIRKHFRGYLSMAKTAAPDSGGSQFFLTFVPTKHLDGKHTVFGRVIEGFDVLPKLQRRDPGASGPMPDRIIEAKVIRKRDHEYKPTKSGEGN